MGAVTTTVQISFGDADAEAGAHLSAEVDSRPDGLNAGKSSFVGGEPVYVLVYKSNNVSIKEKILSAGTIFGAGSEVVENEEFITFSNTRESSISKPASGPLTVTWYGKSLGGISVAGDGVSLTASASGVAVAKVVYKSNAQAFRISTPLTLGGSPDYSILLYILGESS